MDPVVGYACIRSCKDQIEKCNEQIRQKKRKIEELKELEKCLLKKSISKTFLSYCESIGLILSRNDYTDAEGIDNVKAAISSKIQELYDEIDWLHKEISNLEYEIYCFKDSISKLEK